MFLNRELEPLIAESLLHFPVVLLMGARQVGKSTLSLHLPGFKYITLDDTTQLSAAKNDPENFIASCSRATIIDEIQKAPELLPAIKKTVDEKREHGRFLRTGSADLIAMHTVIETLSGRIAIFELQPFSMKELGNKAPFQLDILRTAPLILTFDKSLTPLDIDTAVITGGYPERNRITNQQMRYLWTSSYITSYIERDIRDIGQIRNLDAFIRMYNLLAARSGSILNKQSIACDAQLSPITVTSYLELLEQVFQIHRLSSWSINIGKQFIKNPKVYFTDSGILSHLLQIRTIDEYQSSPYRGMIFETFVFSELYKAIKNSLSGCRIHYMRTSDNREIDFIIEGDGNPIAIEVKAGSTVRSDDFKHIRFIQQSVKDMQGIIIYQGTEIIPFGANCFAVPVTTLM